MITNKYIGIIMPNDTLENARNELEDIEKRLSKLAQSIEDTKFKNNPVERLIELENLRKNASTEIKILLAELESSENETKKFANQDKKSLSRYDMDCIEHKLEKWKTDQKNLMKKADHASARANEIKEFVNKINDDDNYIEYMEKFKRKLYLKDKLNLHEPELTNEVRALLKIPDGSEVNLAENILHIFKNQLEWCRRLREKFRLEMNPNSSDSFKVEFTSKRHGFSLHMEKNQIYSNEELTPENKNALIMTMMSLFVKAMEGTGLKTFTVDTGGKPEYLAFMEYTLAKRLHDPPARYTACTVNGKPMLDIIKEYEEKNKIEKEALNNNENFSPQHLGRP